MMDRLLEKGFATSGARRTPVEPGPDCLSDDLIAGYIDGALSATENRQLEDHSLLCGDCHLVLKTVVDVRGLTEAATATVPPKVSLVARIAQRGLQLLNPLEVRLRTLLDEGLTPALGAVRGDRSDASDVIAIEGPGQGLDELQIQLQPDGQVRLQVRGDTPPPVRAGEVSSVLLEVDGMPREKRPYTGEPLAFAPQGHGHFRIRLVARAPGEDARDLSEASVELRA
jgi:hypothetical protein